MSWSGRTRLDSASRQAVRRLLDQPTFELIPLSNALAQAKHLPSGARVSVTASPSHAIETTIELAADLRQAGFDSIPHLSAHMTRDKSHIASILSRLEAAGVDKAFLVGGDAELLGDFPDAHSLHLAMDDVGHHLVEIGITAYPEGHHFIPDEAIRRALHDKAPYASYMTTQMCFDAGAIDSFLSSTRADGINLPVHIGLPGVADRLKLMSISARIGVGQSISFLAKNRGLISRFMRPARYTPDQLLASLGPTLAERPAAVEGAHIYTFNQCATTEAWRQDYLAALGA